MKNIKRKNIREAIKEYKEKLLKEWKHQTWLLFYKYVKVWVK